MQRVHQDDEGREQELLDLDEVSRLGPGLWRYGWQIEERGALLRSHGIEARAYGCKI